MKRDYALRLFTLGAVVAAVIAACSIYDASLLLPARTDEDASTDAAIGADANEAGISDGSTIANEGGCVHEAPPAPPAFDDGDASIDSVLAIRYLRVVVGGAATMPHPAAPAGFDLDNRCTCPDPSSCVAPSPTSVCDLDGGVDNATGELFASFAQIAPSQFSDDGLNTGARNGDFNTLLRLRDYNGGMNDTRVTLIAYLSAGTDGIQDGGMATPKNDGTGAVWTIDPVSLFGGDTVDGGATCEGNDTVCVPALFDTSAYVTNGVLVAHLSAPIVVGDYSSRLTVNLQGAVLTAALVTDGTTVRIDEGRVGGRWRLTDFLVALASVKDPLNGQLGLCGDSGTYANVKASACKMADVTATAGADNTGGACDALSAGASFSAGPAHLGPIFASPVIQRCGASYTDSCAQ